MAGGYQQLVVWQKAMDLVTAVYLLTEHFPKLEQFGLTSQMRRCAVSIPSNIAEGSKRSTKADFKNFLVFALGSGAELETQLEIAKRLGYMSEKSFGGINMLLSEVMRMPPALISSVKTPRDK